MKEYSLTPESFEPIRRKLIRVIVVLLVLILIIGSAIALSEGHELLLDVALTALVFATFVFSSVRAVKSQRRQWESYRLQVSTHSIVRKQHLKPDLEIACSQIAEILETTNEGLVIRGANRHQIIYVPPGLDDYDEFKDQLRGSGIREFVPPTASRKKRGVLLLLLVLLGGLIEVAALVIVVQSNDARFVVPFGLVFVVGLTWCIVEVRRSPHIDSKLKRRMVAVLIPVVVVAVKVVFVVLK